MLFINVIATDGRGNLFKVGKSCILMNNKKVVLFFFLAVLGILPIVSAQSINDQIFTVGKQAIDAITSFARPFFEVILGEYSTSDLFLQKSLFLILLFVVLNAAAKAIPNLGRQKAASTVVALIVSILAVRFISDKMFQGILISYGTIGIALTTILPFLAFFYFVHVVNMGGLGRRLMWMFFGIVFVALFISRFGKIEPVGQWIYILGIVLIVLAFMFDKGIHRYFFLHELNVFYRGAANKTVAALQAEYMNIVSLDTPQANARRTAIEARLRALGANVP